MSCGPALLKEMCLLLKELWQSMQCGSVSAGLLFGVHLHSVAMPLCACALLIVSIGVMSGLPAVVCVDGLTSMCHARLLFW